MRSLSALSAGLAVAAMALLAGCGDGGTSSDKSTITITYSRPPQIEVSKGIKKIAIAEFSGRDNRDSRWGEITSDKLASALDEYNRKFNRYDLVDRKNLKNILGEQDLQLAVAETGGATKIGKIAKVDAMIYGSVKINVEHVDATKTVPNFSGGMRNPVKTVHYKKLKVTAVITFTMDDIGTSKTIVGRTLTEDFDSDRDNKQKGFAAALKSLTGSQDQVAEAEAANVLIDRCVQQFISIISPHEIKVSERLAKSKSKLVSSGNKLATAGEYGEALTCYQDALAVQPDDDAALYNAGLVCEATGKHKEAAEYYGKAFRANPERVEYAKAKTRVSEATTTAAKENEKE